MDDFERLRNRPGPPDRGRPPDPGAPRATFYVASSSASIGVGRFFKGFPARTGGAEVEGGAGTLAYDATAPTMILLTGPGTPAPGYFVQATHVPHRWAAAWRGATGGGKITIPSCFCPLIPADLAMSSSDTVANGGLFQQCTLHYGPTPPEYSGLPLGASCFLSVESFVDANGETYRYYFQCQFASFFLSRVYAVSTLGSPHQDTVRYTWNLGAAGNACDPFLLSNGTIYSGGDPSSVVTISDGTGP